MATGDPFEPGELVRVFLGARGSKWARVVRALSPGMLYVEILHERTRARVRRECVRRLDDLLSGCAPPVTASVGGNVVPLPEWPDPAGRVRVFPSEDDHDQTNARRWSGAGRDGTGE